MADIKKELMQDLYKELETCVANIRTLDKLVYLLQDSKSINRKQIDIALAKSLRHCNKTNAQIIRLVGFLIEPSTKNSDVDNIFGNIFGNGRPF